MDNVKEILQKAIEKEVTAYQEYLEAVQETTDPEAKALLEQLAQEEARHRQILETQLALLLEAKGDSENEGASRDLEGESCEVELEGAKRAASVLAEAKREVEKAQQAKDELYAMVTHDLRSPLISMVAFSQKLLTSLDNKVSEKEYKKLRWIWSEARRMEEFVNNFLDLARLTSDKVVLDFQLLDPRLMVDEALEPLRPQIQEKSLHVEVTMGGLPGIEADAWAMKRLFMNLLTNAVLHGKTGGTIEIGGEKEDGMIRFWVKDDGPGIREQDLPHIFEQFHTAAAGHKGSGLGLAIAQEVVQTHGGRIWVESTEGEGATFYFILPKAQEKKGDNSSPA
jgi:signal transduction histidine kinase